MDSGGFEIISGIGIPMDSEVRSVLAAIRKLSTGAVGTAVEAHRIAREAHLSEGQVVVALDVLESKGLALPCAVGGQLTAAGAAFAGVRQLGARRSLFGFRRVRPQANAPTVMK